LSRFFRPAELTKVHRKEKEGKRRNEKGRKYPKKVSAPLEGRVNVGVNNRGPQVYHGDRHLRGFGGEDAMRKESVIEASRRTTLVVPKHEFRVLEHKI